jgi:exopolysaccharide production protein ExoZ
LKNGASMETRAVTLPLPAPGTSQIDVLQLIRAVAVLLVAWIHAGQMLVMEGHPETPDLGIFGVDLFFVISGFIMTTILARPRQTAGPVAAWNFLKRRMIRIYPLYFIVLGLALLRAVLRHQHFSPLLPTILLLPSPHPPYTIGLFNQSWTLVFEMLFYLVITAALLFTRRAAQVAIVLLTVTVLLSTSFDIVRPVVVYLCNPIVLEFVFGAAIALIPRRLPTLRRLGPLLMLLGGALAVTLQALVPDTRHPAIANGFQMILANDSVFRRAGTWGIAGALIVAGAVFWAPHIQSRFGKLGLLLGNASYSIYLTSEYALQVGVQVLKHTARSAQHMRLMQTLVCQVLLVVLSCAVGAASYLYLEWPIVRRLQARFT